LETSREPVMVVGLEASHRVRQETLVALAEQWGAPVITMPMSKGLFPEDHPLFAGVHSVYGHAAVQQVLDMADCVLAIGLDGSDFIKPWRTEATTFQVQSHAEVDSTFRADYVLVGDLEATLQTLLPHLSSQGEWGERVTAASRAQIQAQLAPKSVADSGPVPPQTLLSTLRRLLPPEAVFACDVGAHKLLACQWWQSTQPGTFLASNGLSTMGFGMAAALAAKLHSPHRPAVCVTGDGGLLMYAGELETVARLDVALIIIVMVDSTLALIRLKSEQSGYAGKENDFTSPDYLTLAQAFGLKGVHIRHAGECEDKLRQALQSSSPTLVAVEVDVDEYRRMNG